MSEQAGADQTLHQRILGDIERKIVSGEWPVGHRIPFEVDLAQDYGCSRMTVNKVLSQLARAGLVERVRRGGTFVRQPKTESAVLEISNIRREVEALGLAYSFRMTEFARRRAAEDEKDQFDLARGAEVLETDCIHYAAGQPFCFEQRQINLAVVPEAAAASFDGVTPGEWLLRQIPWSSAEHRIQAVPASAAVGAALRVAVGTACLMVERRTWSDAGPVTHVTLTYPGNRHQLFATFAPAS